MSIHLLTSLLTVHANGGPHDVSVVASEVSDLYITCLSLEVASAAAAGSSSGGLSRPAVVVPLPLKAAALATRSLTFDSESFDGVVALSRVGPAEPAAGKAASTGSRESCGPTPCCVLYSWSCPLFLLQAAADMCSCRRETCLLTAPLRSVVSDAHGSKALERSITSLVEIGTA